MAKVENPMNEPRGGGCPWECDEPCVAEMFQKATSYYSKNVGQGPPGRGVPGLPLCFRNRNRGENGTQARILGQDVEAAEEGSAEQREVLAKCEALGWDEFPWSQVEGQVAQLAAMLRSKGLERGDRLCLFADASAEWNLLFYASMYVVIGVCVREPRMPIPECIMIINTCEPKMVIVNPTDRDALQESLTSFDSGGLEEFPWAAANGAAVQVLGMELAPLLSAGSDALANDTTLGACDGKAEDVAVLVTTSGTTGTPKAAVHSQKALYHLARFGEEMIRKQHTDPSNNFKGFVSERYVMPFDAGYISYILMLVLGVATGMEACYLEVQEMRGNQYQSVGRLSPCCMMMLSDMATALCHKVQGKAKLKPLGIGTKAMKKATSFRSVESFAGQNTAVLPPNAGGCWNNLCDAISVAKLRKALGGRVRLVGAGGAKIEPDVIRWFWGAGLPLYEMYASTEAICITFNVPDAFQIGSPGIVASHGPPHASGDITDLKIAEVPASKLYLSL